MENSLKDIKNIIFILAVTIIYPLLMNEKANIIETINLLLIITLSICVCNIIVSYFSNKKYLSQLYKYLSVSFFSIGIVAFGYIYIIKNSFFEVGFWKNATDFNTIFSIYESLILIYSFIWKNKKENINLYFNFITVGAVITSFIGTNYIHIIRLIFGTHYIEGIRIISRTIAFLLKIYLLKIILVNKEIASSNVHKYFIIFVLSRIILHMFGFLAESTISNVVLFTCCSLIFIGNYCIVKIMLIEIIRNPQEFLYKDLVHKTNELEKIIVELKEVNNQKEIIKNDYERKTQEERIKNEILGNISHEFKTPINVIYAAIQTQELKSNSEYSESCTNYNFIIKQNCNRLIRLVNNFIDVTRFDNGEIEANLENKNIVELTEDIVTSSIPFAESKNLNLIFDTSHEELYCCIDTELYERLILNILSNSIKYTNIEGDINVNINGYKNKVKISIEDHGIGISEENLKIIFNRFERADKTFSRDTEGSGLGLSIAQKIIEVLNGRIEVFSKEKKGTTVVITLPISHSKVCSSEENQLISENIKHEADIEMSDIYFT